MPPRSATDELSTRSSIPMSQGTVVTDRKSRIVYANRAYAER